MNPNLISRREAIARVTLLLGATLIGGESLLRGSLCAGAGSGPDFTAADLALLDEIGETIIPATNTPGAKAAGIGAFMAMMVRDCYTPAQQREFTEGLAMIAAASRSRLGKDFLAATAAERTALLNGIAAAQRQPDAPGHYFRMFKELTLIGYFTSEIGATQVLQYVEVPGRFDGNAPYRKGDRPWYTVPTRLL